VYLAAAATRNPAHDVIVENSIIANNTDGIGIAPDVFAGTNRLFSSGGNNLLGNDGYGFSDGMNDDHVGSPDYIVTGITDTFDGSSGQLVLSLRDAIHLSNTTAGAAEIWLPAWDFILTIERTAQPTDIEPSYGDLDIKDSLEILGVNGSTSVAWLTSAVADEVFELVGDYDLDNVVGFAGSEALWQTSDGDENGFVGETADYNAWFDNQGNVFSKTGVS
jgi:hypothetical protein